MKFKPTERASDGFIYIVDENNNIVTVKGKKKRFKSRPAAVAFIIKLERQVKAYVKEHGYLWVKKVSV